MDTTKSSIEQTTFITAIKVRPDARKQFAVWQEKMNKVVSDFPGFVSLEMSPLKKANYIEWTSVQRFATNKDLKLWCNSEERKQLMNEVEPFLIDEKQDAIQELDPSQGNKNVTEVFVTRVTPENYDAYRAWASKIQQIEAQFLGYQGIYIQAPEKKRGGNWITILRFDTPEHLDAWLSSRERKAILKESESIVEELQSHRVISPFGGWFEDIAKSSGEKLAVWKQTMLVLLVLFPLVMLELRFLTPLTKGLNRSLATFIGNAISVALVSWPMMPLAIRFLKWWLVPGVVHRQRNIYLGTIVVIILYLIEIVSFWNLL